MTSSTIPQLTNALAAALPPSLDTERRLARTVVRMLGDGYPLATEQLAEALGRPRAEVDRALAKLPGVYRDDEQRIVGFWGLAVVEMPHRLRVGDRQLYTWCAWDTLFLPLILDQTADVESRSPTTGERITLTVSSRGVRDLSPSGTVMTFLLPGERGFSGDVIRSFCHFVHFFASEHAARAWTADHDGTLVLMIEDAVGLARFWAERAFGVTRG